MTLLPAEAVEAYVAEELPGAQAWAARANLRLTYDADQLRLRLPLQGPGPEGALEHYLLQGQFDDYRTLPPIWQFLHPRTAAEVGAAAFPATPQPPIGGASIFITHDKRGGVICAHFNRWAYGEHGGPHGDWGVPSGWENVNTGHAYARTLGDMLQRIYSEVQASPGRMAPLP